MTVSQRKAMVARLRTAFDMFDAGVEMMRQKIRRDNPRAGEAEVSRRLRTWLADRPGARHGDCIGRVRRPRPASGRP